MGVPKRNVELRTGVDFRHKTESGGTTTICVGRQCCSIDTCRCTYTTNPAVQRAILHYVLFEMYESPPPPPLYPLSYPLEGTEGYERPQKGLPKGTLSLVRRCNYEVMFSH